ncbi:unnamed protein product [Prorocentrum cordatum]|uniref:Uncharacterized protein n=1 Tax=Prorocentrum cordatum TaxID=2364126 RepID=A0ABN9W2G9_9DINO|nr:unnamed protein product [Polarella glacialis]
MTPMNGPPHDWGIVRGANGVRYRVVGPRGGPCTSRPILAPREPGGPTPSDEAAAQTMKIHREVDEAHAVAKDTVSHMSVIGAMAKVMGQMLTAHRKTLFITKNVLFGYGDLRYAAPLRILPPSAYRLRARLIRGLAAQMDHITAMLI